LRVNTSSLIIEWLWEA